AVAVDTSGNIYCTGETWSYGAGNYDFALVKFYPDGTKAWNTTWGGSSQDTGYGVTVDASGNVYCTGLTVSYDAGQNDLALVKFDANSPNMPINPSPQNGSTGVNINPLLSVDVWDPNNDLMNVSFYNKTDDSLIGMDINVSSGGSASINWTGLNWETTYEWYAVANDEMNSTRSLNWTFTTMDEPPPPIPGYKIIISAFSIIAVISLIIIGRTHKKLLQRNLNLK
ncbi:MAG: SBBP repeat-containing protein, partial [Promethearchaeota archaeon]